MSLVEELDSFHKVVADSILASVRLKWENCSEILGSVKLKGHYEKIIVVQLVSLIKKHDYKFQTKSFSQGPQFCVESHKGENIELLGSRISVK